MSICWLLRSSLWSLQLPAELTVTSGERECKSKCNTLVSCGEVSFSDSSVSIGFIWPHMDTGGCDVARPSLLCMRPLPVRLAAPYLERFAKWSGVISRAGILSSSMCLPRAAASFISDFCCCSSSAAISRLAWLSSDLSSSKSRVFVLDSYSSNSAISSFIMSNPDGSRLLGCRFVV